MSAEPSTGTQGSGDVGPIYRLVSRLLSHPPAVIVAAMTLLGFGIRLFRLDSLPAEMWGDVTVHYSLATQVLQGHYYLDYEFGGDGPLFSYVVAVIARVFGLSFYTLKLTTAVIGTLLIVAVYFYTKTLFESRRIGYIAAFLTAVSFWSITFSRQAKPYILVPLLVAVALTFALRGRPLLAGIALGLGMYAQAAFWGAPIAFIFMPVALVVAAVVAFPVLDNFVHDPSSLLGSGSYIGGKLQGTGGSPLDKLLTILDNMKKNALSFNVIGDHTFRHNIVDHPHLDVVSGLLFLLGMALIVTKIVRTRDRRLLLWFLLPFLILQIPSVLDQVPSDSPNMGRLTSILPLTLAAIAYGIEWLTLGVCSRLKGRVRRPAMASAGVTAVLLVAIFGINMVSYFEIYPRGLPNDNTPFDLVIALSIDRSPRDTTSILVGCCWGEWSQPEPDAVVDRTTPGRGLMLAGTVQDASRDVQELPAGSHVAVYLSPSGPVPVGRGLHLDGSRVTPIQAGKWQVAWLVTGQSVPGGHL